MPRESGDGNSGERAVPSRDGGTIVRSRLSPRKPAHARRIGRAMRPAADDPCARSAGKPQVAIAKRAGERDLADVRELTLREATAAARLRARPARARPFRPGARAISPRAFPPAASGPRTPPEWRHREAVAQRLQPQRRKTLRGVARNDLAAAGALIEIFEDHPRVEIRRRRLRRSASGSFPTDSADATGLTHPSYRSPRSSHRQDRAVTMRSALCDRTAKAERNEGSSWQARPFCLELFRRIAAIAKRALYSKTPAFAAADPLPTQTCVAHARGACHCAVSLVKQDRGGKTFAVFPHRCASR